LLGLWGIPHGVLEPVAFHEHPGALEHETLEVVDVVHLADRVAAELVPSPFQPQNEPLDLARFAKLGVDQARLDALRAEAKDQLVQTRELLRS
jgi:HD-like signal output (HDOD) protein